MKAPLLQSGKDSFPAFSISAARAKDGKVYIAIANMDPQNTQSIRLALGGLKVKAASGQILTHAKMDAHNVPGAPETITPAPFKGAKISNDMLTLTIPAKSVVVVRLD